MRAMFALANAVVVSADDAMRVCANRPILACPRYRLIFHFKSFRHKGIVKPGAGHVGVTGARFGTYPTDGAVGDAKLFLALTFTTRSLQ